MFACSYEEIPGIDSRIVEHEVKTYPDAKHVRQCLSAMNPRKEPAIKTEIEKLLKANFTYPIRLTKWVSNPVPVDKKQGMICVCTDFRDLNCACPKDNFPTPFIDQILDECAGSEVFSFMDNFSGYNQIQINLRTNIRLHLFVLGEILHIKKCLSALKTLELHFNGK